MANGIEMFLASKKSEAAAKERIAKWSANEKDDLGFAIETLDDPPVLAGNIGLWGARPKDRCATLGIALGREYIGRGYGADAIARSSFKARSRPTHRHHADGCGGAIGYLPSVLHT